MTEAWEKYSFYKILGIKRGADADAIKDAYRDLVASLDPAAAPEGEKKAVALARLTADAAFETLSDEKSKAECDARLEDLMEAASKKKRVESKRKGKLQEQQTIDEDEKLRKATEQLDTATSSLADLYYDRLFKSAKESKSESVTSEKLMEWLSSERAESARASQQRGGRLPFQIDWSGFTSVQDKRKERGDEIAQIVDELTAKL